MSNEYLETYLNDHLAGSEVAIELLVDLEEKYAGSSIESFVSNLRTNVLADQEKLKTLMSNLGIPQSHIRRATAWITEKITELKLRFDDPKVGDLLLLEAFEALAIGIRGKQMLWRALAITANESPPLQVLDYEDLDRRAEDQANRVEDQRLRAAKRALTAGP
jgi:hypothetical protein